MVVIIEDVDAGARRASSNGLRRGHYPDKELGSKVAQALRKVADQLEA